MTTFLTMNIWATTLMSGMGTIWVGMLSAVAYRVTHAHRERA